MNKPTPPSYRDRIYQRYVETTFRARNELDEDGIRRTAKKYAHYFGPHLPDDRSAPILELGCGAGAFLLCCKQLGYTDLSGLDISPEQVEVCHANGLDQVVCASAQDFLADQTGKSKRRYALIVMSDVLEHLPKAEVLDTLESVRAHLFPGGRVILRVPNLSNPLNLRTRYVDFTHECGFTKESLEQVLRAGGFRVVSVEGEYTLHRRWAARLIFDRLMWQAFLLFYRRTLHLGHDVIRGKNLIAIGEI